jgi:hypothetical protein
VSSWLSKISQQACKYAPLELRATLCLSADPFYQLRDALDEGLRIARIRYPDGKGEEARILRKKAILFDTIERLPGVEKKGQECLTSIKRFGTASEAELMRGQAEQLRKEILGDAYSAIVDDEEIAYARLIYPFKR